MQQTKAKEHPKLDISLVDELDRCTAILTFIEDSTGRILRDTKRPDGALFSDETPVGLSVLMTDINDRIKSVSRQMGEHFQSQGGGR